MGENLQDHAGMYVRYACTKPITIGKNLSKSGMAKVGLQWLLTKKGQGASNQFETGAFVRTRDANYGNMQFQFVPFGGDYHLADSWNVHGFQAKLTVQRPESRGRISLASADPWDIGLGLVLGFLVLRGFRTFVFPEPSPAGSNVLRSLVFLPRLIIAEFVEYLEKTLVEDFFFQIFDSVIK